MAASNIKKPIWLCEKPRHTAGPTPQYPVSLRTGDPNKRSHVRIYLLDFAFFCIFETTAPIMVGEVAIPEWCPGDAGRVLRPGPSGRGGEAEHFHIFQFRLLFEPCRSVFCGSKSVQPAGSNDVRCGKPIDE